MKGDALLGLARDVLAAAGEPEVELYLRVAERGCARFGAGEINQHMQLSEPQAALRVAYGGRVAETVTTRLDPDALVDAVRATAAAARLVPEIDGFPGFAHDEGAAPVVPPRFAATTANAGAQERVDLLAPVLEMVRAAGLVGAGMLETSVVAHAIATTAGCARSHDATFASWRVWALETPGAAGAAGYGGHVHRDVSALRLAEEAERAIRNCRDGRNPATIDPGAYDVVLEPEAVSELLEWLGSIAFAAPEVEQGSSPVAGHRGERVTGEIVDLLEDPLSDHPDLGFGAPFDREGTWRRTIPLIERGVARDVLYDRTYAARADTSSTGSALLPSPGSSAGIGACALALGAGQAANVDDLVAGMERGLYVCRLHYVNGLVDPRRAVMTGRTRDGCFLVERGRIRGPVHNLRFTDSLLDGLARCDGMTRSRRAVPTWWDETGVVVAPAVRIRGWHFGDM